MSRRSRIIAMFMNGEVKMSCQDITNKFIEEDNLSGSVANYLSGCISSILNKLVIKDHILKYAEGKSVKGGHLYELNFKL